MLKIHLHITKATLLLLLFSFALVSQGIHQMEYPAEETSDCTNNNKHLHQDTPNHNCDLCEYQITFWVNDNPVSEVLPQYVAELKIELQDAPAIRTNYVVALRGPPSC